ncbi:MAG: T9SS type A sorting domain-containing protein [Limnohabitans sp.]|nr:T9SS type A sorting domain-containing protein [Limnohabitans sp.]
MKKRLLFIFCSFMAFFMLSTEKSNAQYKILGQNFYDYCSYQSITVFSDSTSSSTYKIELSYGDGQKDTTVTYGYLTKNHNYSSPGTYTVKSVLIDAATWTRMDSATMSVAYTGCTVIKGSLYVDNNSNCLLDIGDDSLEYYTKIEVDSSSIAIDTIYGSKTFEYRALASTATSYSFKVISTATGLSLTCPSIGKLTATSSIGSTVYAGAFGFTCSTSVPVDISINPVTHAGRHGMFIETTLSSNSCTKTSGTISITMDSKYSLNYAYPAGATIVGNKATWSYTNLSLLSSKYFYAFGSTPSTWLTPGTSVTSSIYATPIADADSNNNKATITDTVTSSWDPNDKQVSPKGTVASGTTLNYTLSFENTGNAPAKNIHLLDTLSSNLDVNSLQVITSSHTMKLYKTKLSSGKTVLNFDFPNINLLDSSHHGLCDGFVKFSIKTKAGLPNGTVINNRAGIYFDDNEVVLTNTTANVIGILNIPSQSSLSNLLVYPNPAGDYVTIKAPLGSYDNIELMNNLGQVILQQHCQGIETQVNINSFVPGIYYLVSKGQNGVSVQKIEKH